MLKTVSAIMTLMAEEEERKIKISATMQLLQISITQFNVSGQMIGRTSSVVSLLIVWGFRLDSILSPTMKLKIAPNNDVGLYTARHQTHSAFAFSPDVAIPLQTVRR
jgi:hypothetical protein